MPLPTDDRINMLKQIATAYRDLDQQIEETSSEALERPNTVGEWSGKDLIAHLADWEAVLRDQLAARDAGEPFEWPTANRSEDEVNAEMLERSRSRSLDEVKTYFRDTHFSLMEVLEQSDSVDPAHALNVTKGHYEEHQEDLANLKSS